MTVAVWAVVVVLLGHWLSDFVWQPHWMGLRKSKEWWVLTQHALRISAGMFVTGVVVSVLATEGRSVPWIALWALVNGGAHFGIDAVTSRITSRLWKQERVHGFFTVIGFDQFLHVSLAVITLTWLARTS